MGQGCNGKSVVCICSPLPQSGALRSRIPYVGCQRPGRDLCAGSWEASLKPGNLNLRLLLLLRFRDIYVEDAWGVGVGNGAD